MDKISIGLLLPSSSIFPIGKDFEKGLKDGLTLLKQENIEVEIIKEFIGNGELKLTENACNKFFDFDDVDLITGVISNRAACSIAERIKRSGLPLLISNPGAHVPVVNELNEYIYHNSMHLWRHAWTLGNWGVKTFGKKGMYISAVYDAGYGFSQMFYEGMIAADPTADWSFSVPPMPPQGALTDMSIIFPFLEQYQPDFILATFCGTETTLFLNEFIAREWHHKTKIVGLPYLLSPFSPLSDDITIYTTLPFEEAPEVSPPQGFYHLGLQAGNYISAAARAATSRSELKDELAKLPALFNVTDNKSMGHNKLTIVEHTIKANEAGFASKNLNRWDVFPIDAEAMMPLTAQPGAGWFNPYLCI